LRSDMIQIHVWNCRTNVLIKKMHIYESVLKAGLEVIREKRRTAL
jgi:hypothetical protein